MIGFCKWALIELARNQSFQAKLREELSVHFSHGGDPTYDQLASGLPYLDSVVHEVLRLHPPVWETNRIVRTFSFRSHPMSFTDLYSYPLGSGG
jgi:cytochrome P450